MDEAYGMTMESGWKCIWLRAAAGAAADDDDNQLSMTGPFNNNNNNNTPPLQWRINERNVIKAPVATTKNGA